MVEHMYFVLRTYRFGEIHRYSNGSNIWFLQFVSGKFVENWTYLVAIISIILKVDV